MNFAESLRNYNEEEEMAKRIQVGKENAIRIMVQTTQKAIEFSARKASLCGKRKISGYVTETSDYDTDTVYSIEDLWEYPDRKFRNECIHRIDTIDENFFFLFPRKFAAKCSLVTTKTIKKYSSQETSGDECKLKKAEMDTLCNEVATMIASLGFYDYKVETVPMHFYSSYQEKREGFFGSKWVTKKIDEGIGYVLKVTVSW